MNNNQQSGIEVRLDGELVAFGNSVWNNQGHGVLMAPFHGACVIGHNEIIGNRRTGIRFEQCNEIEAAQSVCEEKQKTSKPLAIIINGNTIVENGSHGLALNCVNTRLFRVTVEKNSIASNFFLGILLSHLTEPELLVVIENNTIEGNRCGGIGFAGSTGTVPSIRDNVIENSGLAFAKVPRDSNRVVLLTNQHCAA